MGRIVIPSCQITVDQSAEPFRIDLRVDCNCSIDRWLIPTTSLGVSAQLWNEAHRVLRDKVVRHPDAICGNLVWRSNVHRLPVVVEARHVHLWISPREYFHCECTASLKMLLGSYPLLNLHVDAVVVETTAGFYRGHCKRTRTWGEVLRLFIVIVGFSLLIIVISRKLFIVGEFGAAGRRPRGGFTAGGFGFRLASVS